MTPAALGASLLGALLARELVVNTGVISEARATGLVAAGAEGTGTLSAGAVARPSISLDLDVEGARARALRAGYAPQVAVLGPSAAPLVLHTASLQGSIEAVRRLELVAAVDASAGDLDPSTSRMALQRTSGAVELLAGVPYMAGSARAGARARVTRTVLVDLSVRLDAARTPASAVLPAMLATAVDGTLAWQLRTSSSVVLEVRGRTADMGARGDMSGATGLVGLRHSLSRGLSLQAVAGAGRFTALTGDDGARTARLIPTLEAWIDRAPGAATGAGVSFRGGLMAGPVSDPFGAVLEERVGATVEAGWRARHDLTMDAGVMALAPTFAVGVPTTGIVDALVGVRGLAAWTVVPRVALQVSVFGTARWQGEQLVGDLTIGLALAATMPVLHRGAASTAGRAVGAAAATAGVMGVMPSLAGLAAERYPPSLPEDPLDAGRPPDAAEDDAPAAARAGLTEPSAAHQAPVGAVGVTPTPPERESPVTEPQRRRRPRARGPGSAPVGSIPADEAMPDRIGDHDDAAEERPAGPRRTPAAPP